MSTKAPESRYRRERERYTVLTGNKSNVESLCKAECLFKINRG